MRFTLIAILAVLCGWLAAEAGTNQPPASYQDALQLYWKNDLTNAALKFAAIAQGSPDSKEGQRAKYLLELILGKLDEKARTAVMAKAGQQQPAVERMADDKAREACQNNLRQLSGSKDQFALDHNNSAPRTMGDLSAYLIRTHSCPAGGTYTLGQLGTDVECSLSARGHTI